MSGRAATPGGWRGSSGSRGRWRSPRRAAPGTRRRPCPRPRQQRARRVVGLGRRQRAERLDAPGQPAQRRLGRVHRRRGEVELAAVVAAEQEQPVGHRVVAGLDQVGQPRHGVPDDLAIFCAFKQQELVVQPVPHPRPPVAEVRLALRDLVDVVQLAVVDAAGVDVEMLARAAPSTSPSIPGASQGRPSPTATSSASRAGRRAPRFARGRSRSCSCGPRPARRARPRAGLRGRAGPACRSPATWKCRSTARTAAGRCTRAPRAGPRTRSCPARTRWPAGRRRPAARSAPPVSSKNALV